MSPHWQLFRVIHQMMEWDGKLERWGEQEGMQICWGRQRGSWWNISWTITPRFSRSAVPIHTLLCFPCWKVTSRLCAAQNFKQSLFYYLTVLRRLLIQFYSTLQCQVTTRYLSTQVWTKLIKETETTTKEKTASKKSWMSKTYFNRQKPSTDPRIFGFTEKCTNKTRSLDPWF